MLKVVLNNVRNYCEDLLVFVVKMHQYIAVAVHNQLYCFSSLFVWKKEGWFNPGLSLKCLDNFSPNPWHHTVFECLYRSLPKERPWAEHLTSLPKRGVGALSTVSAFNHERAPTSCLQRLKALEANNWTQNNVQRNHPEHL